MGQFMVHLLPLMGVVVGSAGTLIAAMAVDRMRWRRDLAIRWDEHRLNAYSAFAASLKELTLLLARMTGRYRPGSSTIAPLDWEDGIALVAQAEAVRSQALEKVLLLGDGPTVTAARNWSDAVGDLRVKVMQKPGWYEEAGDRITTARSRFYDAARAGLMLGSAGGVGPAAPLPEP